VIENSIALATCIIISPVFSYEYQVGTDAILLPAKRGRGATVHAKILAGWIVTSIVYVVTVLIGVGIIAATFGVLGWNCDFQILSLNSFYEVQIWQVVLYGIGINYIVILSVMTFTMLLSSICKTTFTTVIISTLCTVAPMFFPASQDAIISHLVALLPAKAMITYSVFSSYDVYSVGKLVITLPCMILLVAVVFGMLELQIARRQYCRHQVV
jgi:ABC-type transport system involved in multi-copper enzyme maturation permease subunit